MGSRRRGKYRDGMLLAEDLLLLVTDDAGGQLTVPGAQIDVALGGANLVELTLMHKVSLSRAGDEGTPGRIIIRDPTPAGDEVLDASLAIIMAHQGKKPSAVIRPLSKNLRRVLYRRLADRGVVRAEQRKILGLFPGRRWPAQDAGHEADMRQLITQALAQRATPDARTAAIIALVHALRCEHKIVDPQLSGMSRRQLRARAKEIAEGDWAAEAVRRAIDEMIAAIAAASASAAMG